MNILHFVFYFFLQCKCLTSKLVHPNKCGIKLLDDTNLVPDSAFTASSSFEHKNKADKPMDLSAKAARESYDKDNQEFAWCPKNKISIYLKEYLEIDLGRLVVINFAQTKGRFAQGAGKEYIPFYQLHYRREINENWRLYKKFDSKKGFDDILKGPSDPFLDAYETLDPPIVTRWIRIYPFSYEIMHVCMKLQLIGCTFESNVMEYRIPQGSEPKNFFMNFPGIIPTVIKIFQDSSYDGAFQNGLLNGGSGRLTDNKTGGNFMLHAIEAQYYVGWNANFLGLSDDRTLTLVFRFNSIRNFSYMKLNGYENTTMNIALPIKVEVKFSLDGDKFSGSILLISSVTVTKSSSEHSSWILFNLNQKLGQHIHLKIYFQSDWILLSEIDFISSHAGGFNNTIEARKLPTQRTNNISSINDKRQSHADFINSIDAVYILTILLCILVVVIVAISLFGYIMRRKRNKRKKDIKKHELAFYSQNPFKTLSIRPNNLASIHRVSNPYIGKYTSGSLHLDPRPSIGSQHESCMYNHNVNSQNCIIIPKQSIPTNENNVYTSIPGSDNDSSLSTDYMASSGANSSHAYAQTIPVTCSMAEYMLNQPQIIANPLVEYLDNDLFYRKTSKKGLYSFDSEMLGVGNNQHRSSSINNSQSFTGSNIFQPMEFSSVAVEPSFYPITNNYQISLMKHDYNVS